MSKTNSPEHRCTDTNTNTDKDTKKDKDTDKDTRWGEIFGLSSQNGVFPLPGFRSVSCLFPSEKYKCGEECQRAYCGQINEHLCVEISAEQNTQICH